MAVPEPTPRGKFTPRAAVLAIVICAIALTLAYPLREYIAERRQIAALDAQNAQISSELKRLSAEQRQLTSPGYIEQQARDQLHWCFPSQVCYVIVNPPKAHGSASGTAAKTPWYEALWASVRAADRAPARAR